jgi:hypothetical protein
MQVNETTKQEIRELALLYKECLQTVVEEIPSNHFNEWTLEKEDHHNIASNIFIEHNRQAEAQARPWRSHAKTETELSTNKQQAFIGGLAAKGGKKAENIIAQFLDNNEIQLVDKLSKAQATTLINQLKEEQ